MSITNPTDVAYRFPAATLSTAGVIGRIQAPSGMKGVVVDVSCVTTTATTVAACTVDVGTSADPDAYGVQTIPVTAVNLGVNGFDDVFNHEIPEGTLVEVSANGECTAGAGDITVIINWY
jgi:hypothetical protein